MIAKRKVIGRWTATAKVKERGAVWGWLEV
jgi:hypothetical protein